MIDVPLNKRDAVVITALVMMAWAIYYSISIRVLTETPAAVKFDLFFGGDPPRVIVDMTEFSGDHSGRTAAHPLFVLFVNPVGVLVRMITGDALTASALLNSFVGALALGLFYLTIRKNNVEPLAAALFSILMGCSTAHIFSSFLPETYSFSNFGLLAMLLIATYASGKPGFPWLSMVATVFSFGMSKVNVLFGCLMAFMRLFYAPISRRKRIVYLGVFPILVIGLSQLLFLMQSWIYPTMPAFESHHLGQEVIVRNLELKADPLKAIITALPHFFVYNIIAPEVTSFENPGFIVFIEYQILNPSRLSALFLLGVVALFSLVESIRKRIHRQVVFWIMIFYVIFNFCFYPPYSFGYHEYFMFSAHYTFPLFILLALPFTPDGSEYKKFAYLKIVVLVLLIAAVALNNWNFILASLGRPIPLS